MRELKPSEDGDCFTSTADLGEALGLNLDSTTDYSAPGMPRSWKTPKS